MMYRSKGIMVRISACLGYLFLTGFFGLFAAASLAGENPSPRKAAFGIAVCAFSLWRLITLLPAFFRRKRTRDEEREDTHEEVGE